MSPAGGTAMPIPMTREQLVRFQEAFAQIAGGTQDLIEVVRDAVQKHEVESARLRADNAHTRRVVVATHVFGAVVMALVLLGIVRRTEQVVRAAEAIEHPAPR